MDHVLLKRFTSPDETRPFEKGTFEVVLIPRVLDSTTNFIEHPELAVQRIARFASVVGRERVVAGTDCGFATFAGSSRVDPDIAWAKLHALAEGARLASQQLW